MALKDCKEIEVEENDVYVTDSDKQKANISKLNY